jgi:hypothetical protein
MGNWTPGGFVGQMFKTMGSHAPAPQGIPAPTLWGDEATVRARLGGYVSELRMARRLYAFRYPFSEAQVVELFRTLYGPTNRAFSALDADQQEALRLDLEQLWARHNQAVDGTVLVAASMDCCSRARRRAGDSPGAAPAASQSLAVPRSPSQSVRARDFRCLPARLSGVCVALRAACIPLEGQRFPANFDRESIQC